MAFFGCNRQFLATKVGIVLFTHQSRQIWQDILKIEKVIKYITTFLSYLKWHKVLMMAQFLAKSGILVIIKSVWLSIII